MTDETFCERCSKPMRRHIELDPSSDTIVESWDCLPCESRVYFMVVNP